MKVAAIENVRGLDGRGLAITVVTRTIYGHKNREAFKTDGSATHWCWLEDGSSCPHEVWRAWEAYMARNILAGRPAYTCTCVSEHRPAEKTA